MKTIHAFPPDLQRDSPAVATERVSKPFCIAVPSRGRPGKVTGLSKQTMSEVIDAFEQQGLVRQTGRTTAMSDGPRVVRIEPGRRHVLGIDLGARRLTVALADIAGRVLAEADEPTRQPRGAWTIDQIARLSDRLARDNHTHPSRIRSS